jgi:hypothetical protein
LPTLGMSRSCLIAITTPLTESNFITKLITFKEDGKELFFKTLHVGLICNECYKDDDLAKATHCPHNKHKIPPWKSNERQERLRIITEKFDDNSRGARENYGMFADDTSGVFPRKKIKEVLNNPSEYLLFKIFSEDVALHSKYYKTEDPLFLVMAIDPGAGHSETAIVSGYFVNERTGANNYTGVVIINLLRVFLLIL